MIDFHFAVNSTPEGSGKDFAAFARKLEELGFDSLLVPDAPGRMHAVFPTLAWAAAVTSKLQVGSYVIANDLHHPYEIAHHAATLHQLSGGRFILGIGAGRPGADAEYAALGKVFGKPGERLASLAGSLDAIRLLLRGETVSWDRAGSAATNAALPKSVLQGGVPPVLVAGVGQKMLRLAGTHADIVAIGTGPDTDATALTNQVQWANAGATAAGNPPPVINISLSGAGDQLATWFARMPAEQQQAIWQNNGPALLPGTTQEIIAGIHRRYDQFGITSYTMPPDLVDVMAPVVAALARH